MTKETYDDYSDISISITSTDEIPKDDPLRNIERSLHCIAADLKFIRFSEKKPEQKPVTPIIVAPVYRLPISVHVYFTILLILLAGIGSALFKISETLTKQMDVDVHLPSMRLDGVELELKKLEKTIREK